MSKSLLPPAYHIFCDEYGDQSLRRTGSEFFIYSAVVVAAGRDAQMRKWTERINLKRPHWNRRPLHFTDLDERTKLWATRFIGRLPLRCFVVISHKANMYGHRNILAERASDVRVYEDDGTSFQALPRRKLWYSHMVLKVLLERATEWCLARSLRDYKEPRLAEITIAQRGGFYIEKFKDYLQKDYRNSINNTGTLKRYLAWPVVDLDLIKKAPADDVAGLQLADVVSGAFSRAIDQRHFGICDDRYARNIGGRLARRGAHRQVAGWSVTALPWRLWEAPLSPEQQDILRLFGHADEELVRPGPILPEDW